MSTATSKTTTTVLQHACCCCGKQFTPPGSTTNRNNICSDKCEMAYWEKFGVTHGIKVVKPKEVKPDEG